MSRLFTLLTATIGMLVASLMTNVEVQGQAVFLPVFRNFTVRGSVSVPDGGRMMLGGVNSHSEGSVANGVPGLGNLPMAGRAFKNRAIGRETNPSQLSVKADIIIMEEIAAQMLADAARNPGRGQGVNADVLRKAAFISRNVGRSDVQAGGSQGSRYPGDRR